MERWEGGHIGEEKEPQGIPRADLTHPPQTRRTLRREAEGPLDFSLQNTAEGK